MASNAEKASIWWRHHAWIRTGGATDMDIVFVGPSIIYLFWTRKFIQNGCRNLTKVHGISNVNIALAKYNGALGTIEFDDELSLNYDDVIKWEHFSGLHDDVIKWKHFPRYWPFVRGIHRSPVNSTHKGQWRGALMFTLICARINGWVNNREAGDLRRYRAHYDVIVMVCEGYPPVSGGFPKQRPLAQCFDVFFDLRLNKRLSKQSRRRWSEKPSSSLWRHCNDRTLKYKSIIVCDL